jgi:predicted GNAT superfamily acetyltransferase
MDAPPITIRRAETIADYAACQQAQRRAWGIVDDSYVLPIATMVGAQHHGGLVLGAFLPDGEAVGLSFAFLGRSGNRPCLYSQLTGVVPGYQGRGLGSRFKEFQRDYAISIGIEIIAWSFDPLQVGNARFNLHRLGAYSHRYLENMYGTRTDALNAGVPTDRLIAEWPVISEPQIKAKSSTTNAPRLMEGPEKPIVAGLGAGEERTVLVEIPREIHSLRRDAPDLAERWRSAVAEALKLAFDAGYTAIDVIDVEGRPFYILER